jgi:hypothetical protein
MDPSLCPHGGRDECFELALKNRTSNAVTKRNYTSAEAKAEDQLDCM